MKNFYYAATVILFVLLMACCKNGKQKTIAVEFDYPNECEAQTCDSTAAVIQKRVSSYLLDKKSEKDISINIKRKGREAKIKITADSSTINQLLGKDTLLLKTLLTKCGKFEILETYNSADIYRGVIEADKLAKTTGVLAAGLAGDSISQEHPLFSVLTVAVDYNGNLFNRPTIGSALGKDTAAINKALAIPSLFPADILFLWMETPVSNHTKDIFELVAVKNAKSSSYTINNEMIGNAKTSKSSQLSGYEINVSLKNAYHTTWQRLTVDNIGKALAVVIDNKVCMAPIVNAEITGGRFTISGGIKDKVQVKLLAAIMEGGCLPACITIKSIQ